MKKLLFALVACTFATHIHAQDFYDLSTIQTIEIAFAESNWDALLDAEKAGDENYIMAQSVTINGAVFDSVGVKYKGNSTYNANQTKNPLHIELDTYKDHIYENYTDIKLSNVAKDPSFLREVLSYQILRQYMDAPLSNYANVYINGDLMGLYSNSESVSKKFVKSRFYSKNNTFVKCNPPAGAGQGTTDLPNLVYLGTDSTDYYDAYELKSDAGWDELIDLCDTLKNETDYIETILDVDRAIWMLAFDNVFVNLDSYIGGFSQNYYLYRDDNKRFIPVVWDLNESFGMFSMTGSGNLNNTTSKQQLSHELHINDSDFPLISKLLDVPMYKRMYLAHIKTMLEENFDNGSYAVTAQMLHDTIDAAVQADGNKFYTYANFVSNINSDITSGGGGGPPSSAPGITNLMDGRSSYLLGLSAFTATQPVITEVGPESTAKLNQSVTINATVESENAVYIGYRADVTKPFQRVQMYDDGAHNDGAANDGVYGADIQVSSASMQYYIYAENDDIGMFSPQRAEHEYHTLDMAAIINELVINELMADNESVITDGAGDYVDWIEIYNNTDESINLGDYYLTDDASDPTQFQLPSENIAAKGYKVIWASGDVSKGADHANFKLSKDGEEVGLFHDNGSGFDTTDYILFTTQTTDVSYGREWDAAPNWVFFTTSTPNASNGLVGIETNEPSLNFQVYPNPYSNTLTFQNTESSLLNVQVYSLHGQLLEQVVVEPNSQMHWTDQYAAGLRVLVVTTENTKGVFRVIKH